MAAVRTPRGFAEAILTHSESGGEAGGSLPIPAAMFEFDHFVFQANIYQIAFSGREFTWWNKQRGANSQQSRLDRVFLLTATGVREFSASQ